MNNACTSYRACVKCGAYGEQVWVQTIPEAPHKTFGWCLDCRLGRTKVPTLASIVLEALRATYCK